MCHIVEKLKQRRGYIAYFLEKKRREKNDMSKYKLKKNEK